MKKVKGEILDIVDKDGKIIGQAPRSEFHKNPKIIHRVAHCWIFNRNGQILWQQRSFKKDTSPGYWSISCGGHVPHGEKPGETMKRELEEELDLKNVYFHLVDKYLWSDEHQTQLIYLYYAIVNKPIEKFILQKKEVEQVKWIDVWEAQMQYCSGKTKATEWVISQVSRILQKMYVKTL